MVSVFFNTVVLTIILIIMGRKTNYSPSNLLALPLGLSILTLVLALLIKDFYIVLIFLITAYSLRLAFEFAIWQSILAAGIWITWIIFNPDVFKYFMT